MKTADERVIYQTLGFSERGKVRMENQDSYIILQQNDAALLAVADGIGGLADGAAASQFLMQGLENWWQNYRLKLLPGNWPLTELEISLELCIAALNKRLLEQRNKTGSTLSVLLLYQNRYLIKHAGDSRIYFLRDFGLEQLAHDHTWYEREKASIPDKLLEQVRMRNVLVNAIGVKADYFLETAKGDLQNVLLALLCTDGIYKYLTAESMEQLLQENGPVEQKIAHLQQIMQNSAAADNYTAIILQKDKSGYGIKCGISKI